MYHPRNISQIRQTNLQFQNQVYWYSSKDKCTNAKLDQRFTSLVPTMLWRCSFKHILTHSIHVPQKLVFSKTLLNLLCVFMCLQVLRQFFFRIFDKFAHRTAKRMMSLNRSSASVLEVPHTYMQSYLLSLYNQLLKDPSILHETNHYICHSEYQR